MGGFNSDLNRFFAERQSVNFPNDQFDGFNNAEQPIYSDFAEFKPEYYQRLKIAYANGPNLEYNPFYRGRPYTDPKERLGYADFDLNPEYNIENDYLVPEQRSETSQNNRLNSPKHDLPEARRELSLSDYYDNRSGQSSPGSIHARNGYNDRNDQDSFRFRESEDDHSEEFLDDSSHSDFYDVRKEEDHRNAFHIRSNSAKQVIVFKYYC